MKRYLAAFLLLGVSLFLSGCSLQAPSAKVEKPPTIPIGNIWKSSDGGKTWESKSNGAGINFADLEVLDFAFHPSDENIVLVATRNGGLLKTENGGESWTS